MKGRLFKMRDITYWYADGKDLLRRWKLTVHDCRSKVLEEAGQDGLQGCGAQWRNCPFYRVSLP